VLCPAPELEAEESEWSFSLDPLFINLG
jgi:hypothetical protein